MARVRVRTYYVLARNSALLAILISTRLVSIILYSRYNSKYTVVIEDQVKSVIDLIRQVSQLLRAELEELVDVAQATIKPIKPCDKEW